MKFQRSIILNKVWFCLILLFLGLMSASVTRAENYTFVTKWGSHDSLSGQFNGPGGVAVDSWGNVYVADTGNNRIQKFALEEPGLTKPVADFSAFPSSGFAPLKVQFTDQSTGTPTSWNWSFGDESNSTEKNTTHTYSSAGNYTVNLTVSNIKGTDSKLSAINVSTPVLPVFPGCTKSPVDPNNDGLYEDINGNARLDFADVVVYYNYMAWITQSGLVVYFDYNKNGRIDFNDVVKLYNMH
ncbi:MAG: tripartite motif-containing protein 71 [Euryarchaeota archaeon]|nr:tripartite motif-containing protein 71 [Euryarchaeota archaeon]